MTTMSIRGASLFVKVVGRGYPILFMHGGPGLDHVSLLPLRPLADEFTLIFYDHRCNGRSDGAPVSTMTWDNLTADAEALRKEFGFDRWAVLGHSFGGMVALEYALRYPERLSHLLLLDTGADAHWSQQNAPEILAKRGYSPAAVQACRRFFNGQAPPEEFTRTAMHFIGAWYYHLNLLTLVRDVLRDGAPQMRPEAQIFGFGQLSPGWTVMDRLGEIKTPALVMAGRHDFLFPPESQAILADRLPNAQLELIERAGHEAPTEQPAEIIRAIRRFMAAATPGCA